jgi:hypothetical protein
VVLLRARINGFFFFTQRILHASIAPFFAQLVLATHCRVT